jgi:hypothetical protein
MVMKTDDDLDLERRARDLGLFETASSVQLSEQRPTTSRTVLRASSSS